MAPPSPPAAVPGEGRGLLVPRPRGLLEPGADLRGTVRMLPCQRVALLLNPGPEC